jgi:hypothetical protein
MKCDVRCPLMVENHNGVSRDERDFNWESARCIERIKHQNDMPKGFREDAGDCVNCPIGQDLFWTMELGG